MVNSRLEGSTGYQLVPGISTQTGSGQPGPDPGSLGCLSAAAAARALSRTSKQRLEHKEEAAGGSCLKGGA